MLLFLNIMAHLIIIVGIIAMLAYIIRMIVKTENRTEKVIRVFALIVGFLTYFIIRVVGISIPDLIVNSMQGFTQRSFGILGGIIPFVLGGLIAWYCLSTMSKHSNLPSRIVVLISTCILILFTDVYVVALKMPTGTDLETDLLPNLTFVIGLLLFAIFNVRRSSSSRAVKEQEAM